MKSSFAAAIVLLFLTMPLALGHSGSGPPAPVDWRIEGEHFAALRLCDPEHEGRHVRPVALAGASDGEVLERPSGYCRVSYGPSQFEDSWRLADARVRFANLPSGMPADTEIVVSLGLYDPPTWTTIASVQTTAPFGADQYVVLPNHGTFGQRSDVAGDIFFDYYAWSPSTFDFVGLGGSTLYVDYLQFECGNAHPGATSIGFHGFGPDRDLFWQNAAYPFDASAADPEGDPLVASTFSFNNQHTSGEGTTQPHAFTSEGTATVRAWVRDDPTQRCPEADAMNSWPRSRTGTVFAPDWQATLDRPRADRHCLNGAEQPAHGLIPILVGRCTFSGAVDTVGMPTSLVGKAVWRINGEAVASDTSAPYSAVVDLTLSPHRGMAEVDVCFEAVHDIHPGLMCSAPRTVLIL